MRYRYIIAAAIIISFTLSFIHNRQNAIENVRFYFALFDREHETKAVETAIKEYNRYSSTFYNTGDYIRGLGEIPAAMLLKKRLVQDVNMLRNDGLVMVFDRDRTELKNLFFRNRKFAIAETEEVWLIALQDIVGRRPVFNVKGTQINVRYLLRKEQFMDQGEKWIVYEADVYPENEQIPELNIRPVL